MSNLDEFSQVCIKKQYFVISFQITVSKVSHTFSFIFLNKNVIEKIDEKFSCHNISEQHLINNKMLIKKNIPTGNLCNKKQVKLIKVITRSMIGLFMRLKY